MTTDGKGKCRATFVIDGSLHLTSGKVTLQAAHVFVGLSEVTSYSLVKMSLKSTTGAFSGSDIIYTASSTGGVRAVHLKSNALLRAAALSLEGGDKQLSMTRMQNKPLVSVCTATSCVSSVVQVIAPSRSSEESDLTSISLPTLSLKDLVSCTGDLSAALSTERTAYDTHTATMAACVTLDKKDTCDANDETCTQSNGAMQSLKVIARTDLTSSLDMTVTLQDSNMMVALGDVFPSHFVFQSSTSAQINGLKLLVRSSSGNLAYIQQSEVRRSEVRWSRTESLSRIQNNGVVMMDNYVSSSRGVKPAGEREKVNTKRAEYLRMVENLSRLPTWRERLNMQKTDIVVRATTMKHHHHYYHYYYYYYHYYHRYYRYYHYHYYHFYQALLPSLLLLSSSLLLLLSLLLLSLLSSIFLSSMIAFLCRSKRRSFSLVSWLFPLVCYHCSKRAFRLRCKTHWLHSYQHLSTTGTK
jgi:hypothetical protein